RVAILGADGRRRAVSRSVGDGSARGRRKLGTCVPYVGGGRLRSDRLLLVVADATFPGWHDRDPEGRRGPRGRGGDRGCRRARGDRRPIVVDRERNGSRRGRRGAGGGDDPGRGNTAPTVAAGVHGGSTGRPRDPGIQARGGVS